MAALLKVPPQSAGATNGSCKAEVGVSDQFPAGLRVLVVDDDVTCLRILEQMLRRCLYHGESPTLLHWELFSLFSRSF